MNKLQMWKEILDNGNLPGKINVKKLDFVSRWLLATRACVFSMTITSVFVGALIAGADGRVNIGYTLLVLLALTMAHASNNLINDYYDYKLGTDTKDYPRTQYAPHPLASKLITEKQLLGAFFLFSAIELAIGIFFAVKVGIWAILFAVAGFLLSVLYVMPPVKLKYRGLGELAIFLIWGPLITVGTYYVITGKMPLNAWLASIPYGLVVMNVLLGKHLDKFDADKKKGVRTLPVVLGMKNAFAFTKVNTALFFVVIVVEILFRIISPFTLLAFFAAGRFKTFVDILSSKKPKKAPKGFNIWPLWYVAWAFWFNRLAGGLFIVGLIIGIILQGFGIKV